MIIENGQIAFATTDTTAGGLDEKGYPKKAGAETWSDTTPCQYQPVSMNLQSRYQTEHGKLLSWEILVEQGKQLPKGAKRLRLIDRGGEKVGDFAVVSITPLDAVQQTRYIV